MKKIFCLFSVLFLFIPNLILPVSAANNSISANQNKVIDDADIISPDIESALAKNLYSLSEKYNNDIIIVTTASLGGKSAQVYADDYFDDHEYGFGKSKDGLLLLISLDPRAVYISTSGKSINYFSNDKCYEMTDDLVTYLTNANYDSAVIKYAEQVDDTLSSIKLRPILLIFVSLILGFIISSIIVSSMKSKLNTIRRKHNAADYIVPGSMNLSQNKDIFLYNNIIKTKIERNSSGGSSGGTHKSSSGNTHGGAGRSF